MITYIEVNNVRYPAIIGGKMNDRDWDNRESKYIRAEMTYEEAVTNFVNGVSWSIIQEIEEEIEEVIENKEKESNNKIETVIKKIKKEEIFDNSDFSIAGEIVDHRDGTITIKMGKPNEFEKAMATIDELLITMEVL